MVNTNRIARLAEVVLTALLVVLIAHAAADATELTDKQLLGKHLFFDNDLSSPKGQSCGSCHDPGVGFVDPDAQFPTSEGVLPDRFGPRNAPTVTYLATAPPFTFNPTTGASSGGQFWDGRAVDLVEQAKGPFVNPIEMHSPNKKLVIHQIRKAEYAPLFESVFGDNSLNDVESAYNHMAEAIAEFEKSPELNKFNSKFDYFLQGEVELSTQELEGLALFTGPAQCFRCHVVTPNANGGPPVFTSFGFSNVGVPKNPNNLFYADNRSLNPDGPNFVDLGVGAHLADLGVEFDIYKNQLGKMGFPTLRNIEKTAPYFHNGVFNDLKTVVHFFNTRDLPNSGFVPEYEPNRTQVIGNLGLSGSQEDAIVAFLLTLTDDYDLESH